MGKRARISSTTTVFVSIYFGKRESSTFFFFFFLFSLLDKYISCYRYIHRDIYVIASSTRPISSDGKNNGVRSSSGLYLTFLRSYMTLFLLIMRAAQHVSSFIYHFQYHFHPRWLLSHVPPLPVHSLYFAIFLSFFSFFFVRSPANSFPPIISHQRPSRLSSTRTDEPAIRISFRNLCRLKIYRIEIHRRKHDSIKGTS